MLAWFLKNSERLNLAVFRDREVTKYLPRAYDHMVTVQLGEQAIWGRGIDSDETKSLTAACAEVVERATLYHKKACGKSWTSSGIAAHLNFDEAKERAMAELIERDAFLSHYLTFSSFIEIETPSSLFRTKAALRLDGIDLHLGKLQSPSNWHTTVAACFGTNAAKPFGMFIGAATKRSQDESIIKATNEVIAFVSGFLRDSNRRTAEEAFDGPLYHYKFSSEQLNISLMHHFFSKTDKDLYHLDLSQIVTKRLDLHPSFIGCPVTVVRATSPDAQQLFFGETKPEHINFKRLSQFLGKEVRWEDVNKTTHVFA